MQVDLLMLYLAKHDGLARLPKPHLDPLVDLRYAIGIEDLNPSGQTFYEYRITGHGIAFLFDLLKRHPQFVLDECFPIDLGKIKPEETSKQKKVDQ